MGIKFVSIKTMAEDLDMKVRTLQEWCQQGKIPTAVKVGKSWKVQADAWETFKKRLIQKAA